MFLNDEDSVDEQSSYEYEDASEEDEDEQVQFQDVKAKHDMFSTIQPPNVLRSSGHHHQVSQSKSTLDDYRDHKDDNFAEFTGRIPQRNQSPDNLRTKRTEQQKTMLQATQYDQYSHTITQNEMYRYKKAADEIDYSKLRSIMDSQDEKTQMYEPGLVDSQSERSRLPQLQKENDRIQFVHQQDQAQQQSDPGDPVMKDQQYRQPSLEKAESIASLPDFTNLSQPEQAEEQFEPIFDVAAMNQTLPDEAPQVIQNQPMVIDVVALSQPPARFEEYPQPIHRFEIDDIRLFNYSPAPEGGMIQCTVVRDTSGLNHFSPKYDLYLTNQLRHLMSAKKRSANLHSSYIIGLHPTEIEKNNPFYLGNLLNIVEDHEFIFYDDGEDPKKKSLVRQTRKQIGVMVFEKGPKSFKKPRSKQVILPKIGVKDAGNLLQRFEINDVDDITVFNSNPPQWDPKTQSHVLNFHGRVQMASIKNFQLVKIDQPVGQRLVYFQFGKVDNKHFNLDFQYPLTPLQAFMIGLASFDFKLQL